MTFQIEINQKLVTVKLEKRKNIKHIYLRVLSPDLVQIKSNIYYTIYDAKDLIEKKNIMDRKLYFQIKTK